jgi:hypothetical protein
MNQPQIAFLDEIQERQSAIDIATRDLHDQTEIAFDHAMPGGLVAFPDAACKLHFLGCGE